MAKSGIDVVPTLVSVRFEDFEKSLLYYNDSFALEKGDLVYVSGKLAGKPGEVVEVKERFLVKPSSYERIIAAADTEVHGKLVFTRFGVVSFERGCIPYEKVSLWHKAPSEEDDDLVWGVGEEMEIFDGILMPQTSKVFQRGVQYFKEDRILYFEIDHGYGRALVEGSEIYDLAFFYKDGMVYDLCCSCYCTYTCKHEIALFLQLKLIMDDLTKAGNNLYEREEYIAMLAKSELPLIKSGSELEL